MTLASRSSGKLRSVKVRSMLEHRGKERFFQDRFSLAAVNGRHCPSCFQKLTKPGQPGTEGALRPTLMTLIRAPGFQFLIGHELMKLTSSVIVVSGLVLWDTTVMAVMK